jgi:hypothetical protein
MGDEKVSGCVLLSILTRTARRWTLFSWSSPCRGHGRRCNHPSVVFVARSAPLFLWVGPGHEGRLGARVCFRTHRGRGSLSSSTSGWCRRLALGRGHPVQLVLLGASQRLCSCRPVSAVTRDSDCLVSLWADLEIMFKIV